MEHEYELYYTIDDDGIWIRCVVCGHPWCKCLGHFPTFTEAIAASNLHETFADQEANRQAAVTELADEL